MFLSSLVILENLSVVLFKTILFTATYVYRIFHCICDGKRGARRNCISFTNRKANFQRILQAIRHTNQNIIFWLIVQ